MSKVITKNTLLTITSKKAIAGQKVITVRKNTFTDLFSILGGGGGGSIEYYFSPVPLTLYGPNSFFRRFSGHNLR